LASRFVELFYVSEEPGKWSKIALWQANEKGKTFV
jgi:hypothetical protein